MARNKKDQNTKPKPRRGEVWEYTPADSSKPSETWEIQAIEGSGSKATLDVLISWEDSNGNRQSRSDVIPIAKFADPHVELVNEGSAQDEAPAPVPSVTMKPIKNGLALTCPGQGCGDKHEIIIEVSDYHVAMAEIEKAYKKFVERHEPHMLDGTLFGSHKS